MKTENKHLLYIKEKHKNAFLESQLDPMMFNLIDEQYYPAKEYKEEEYDKILKLSEEWQNCGFTGFQASYHTIGKWRGNRFMKLLYRAKLAILNFDLNTFEKTNRILINHFSKKRGYTLPQCSQQ